MRLLKSILNFIKEGGQDAVKEISVDKVLQMFLTTVFVIAPILSFKITEVSGFKLPVGAFMVMIVVAGIQDVINYTGGQKKAKRVYINALIVKFLIYLVVIPAAVKLPAYDGWKMQQVYEEILHHSIKMFIISEIATFIGAFFVDIPIFSFMKRKFNSWVASSMASDFFSGVLINTFIMYFTYAGTGLPVGAMIVSAVMFKTIVCLIRSIVLYPLVVILDERRTARTETCQPDSI